MKIAATKMSERGQFSCLENGTATFLKNCLLLKIVGGRTPQENKTFTRLVSSSRCTMEENYLVQKLSRAVFKTNNIHQCAAT